MQTNSKGEKDRDLGGLMNDSFAYAGSLEKTSPVVYKEEIQQFAESFTFPDLMDVMWSQVFPSLSLLIYLLVVYFTGLSSVLCWMLFFML